jgi:hypothetical protein
MGLETVKTAFLQVVAVVLIVELFLRRRGHRPRNQTPRDSVPCKGSPDSIPQVSLVVRNLALQILENSGLISPDACSDILGEPKVPCFG